VTSPTVGDLDKYWSVLRQDIQRLGMLLLGWSNKLKVNLRIDWAMVHGINAIHCWTLCLSKWGNIPETFTNVSEINLSAPKHFLSPPKPFGSAETFFQCAEPVFQCKDRHLMVRKHIFNARKHFLVPQKYIWVRRNIRLSIYLWNAGVPWLDHHITCHP